MRRATIDKRVDLTGVFEPKTADLIKETRLLSGCASIFQLAGEATPPAFGNKSRPGIVDVGDLAAHRVRRGLPTATGHIGCCSVDGDRAVVSPVALSRTFGCVQDNAVRAARPDGQVTVEVTRTLSIVAASAPPAMVHQVGRS